MAELSTSRTEVEVEAPERTLVAARPDTQTATTDRPLHRSPRSAEGIARIARARSSRFAPALGVPLGLVRVSGTMRRRDKAAGSGLGG